MDFLVGSVSLVFGNASGADRILASMYQKVALRERLFGHTEYFPALPGAPASILSLRNKAFLTGTGTVASLRYGTTETIRWQQTLPFTVL